jgi:hypothetical protein
VVYKKPPFSTPEDIVKYIGRYTHRVAISNSRLISMEDGQIRFKYKNYKKKGFKGYSWEEITLPAEDFIRRFLMHVLPEGFHRIRHYGFLANGRCKAAVKKSVNCFHPVNLSLMMIQNRKNLQGSHVLSAKKA